MHAHIHISPSRSLSSRGIYVRFSELLSLQIYYYQIFRQQHVGLVSETKITFSLCSISLSSCLCTRWMMKLEVVVFKQLLLLLRRFYYMALLLRYNIVLRVAQVIGFTYLLSLAVFIALTTRVNNDLLKHFNFCHFAPLKQYKGWM